MEKIISYCGIKCGECGAFIATKNNDSKKRQEVATEWSEQFKSKINPEDINCKGCISKEEPVFNYCNICEIRKCGIEKNVVNCAYCSDYVCEKLEEFFKVATSNQELLDGIRKMI